MTPLISKEENDDMDSGKESEDEPMSKKTPEDICDDSKFHPSLNRREASYKICDHIKKSQSEWNGELLSTQNMG